MDNKYLEMKERHQKEVNNFPMIFAFTNEQLKEGMEKLGLKPEETDKLYRLGDTGGYYRKTDSEKLHEMFNNHHEDLKKAIAEDKTGEDFIFDMFIYELANHEFCITRDPERTLETLDLTYEDLEKNKALKNGFKKAKKEYLENVVCY
jgi:hypothetical protein